MICHVIELEGYARRCKKDYLRKFFDRRVPFATEWRRKRAMNGKV